MELCTNDMGTIKIALLRSIKYRCYVIRANKEKGFISTVTVEIAREEVNVLKKLYQREELLVKIKQLVLR